MAAPWRQMTTTTARLIPHEMRRWRGDPVGTRASASEIVGNHITLLDFCQAAAFMRSTENFGDIGVYDTLSTLRPIVQLFEALDKVRAGFILETKVVVDIVNQFVLPPGVHGLSGLNFANDADVETAMISIRAVLSYIAQASIDFAAVWTPAAQFSLAANASFVVFKTVPLLKTAMEFYVAEIPRACVALMRNAQGVAGNAQGPLRDAYDHLVELVNAATALQQNNYMPRGEGERIRALAFTITSDGTGRKAGMQVGSLWTLVQMPAGEQGQRALTFKRFRVRLHSERSRSGREIVLHVLEFATFAFRVILGQA